MPELAIDGTTLHYDVTGDGPETIVFLHGLLWSGAMYAAQVAAFARTYRCVTLDFRGQGRSAVSADGYDMETLARDVVTLLQTLGGEPVHLVGLSMGGFVAMRVAARCPKLVRSLALLETSADPEDPANVARYRLLGAIGRLVGLAPVADRVMPIMFGRTFLHDRTRSAERRHWRDVLIANDRVGVVRALRGVIERRGVLAELRHISAPTLVVVGLEDVATVPAKAERIAAGISGARLMRVPKAGHSSPIEEPAAITAALATFFAESSREGPLRSRRDS